MRITDRGQLTIPKPLRLRYGITASTDLDMRETEDGILLVKRGDSARFERFRGCANAQDLPPRTDEVLRQLREGS